MTEKCENCNGNPVDIAEATQGTPTVKLVAILIAQGITDTKRLAEVTGLKIRAVQAARNALQCAQQNAPAQHTAPKTQQNAPSAAECAQHTAPLARAYKESLRDSSYQEIDSVSQSRANVVELEPAGWSDLKTAFNGSTEAMLADVQAYMGPLAKRTDAVKWLSGTMSAYGAQRTAQAWTIITTKRAQGEPVANPLPLWAKTAGGLKASTSAAAAPKRISRW